MYIAKVNNSKKEANTIRRGFFKAYKDRTSKIIINSPGGIIIELMISDNTSRSSYYTASNIEL